MRFSYFELPIVVSIVIYVLIVFLSVLFIYKADVANKVNKRNKYLLLTFIVLALPSMVRYGVGNDYLPFLELSQYFNKFSSIASAKAAHNVEYSFILLSFVFKEQPMMIFAFYSFFTQLFVLLGIWYFRKDVSPAVLMFLYTTSFYLRTCNIFRQALAIAIVFFALRYIKEQKFFNYLLSICIAFLFHKTAAVAVLLYVWFRPSKYVGLLKKIVSYTWPLLTLLLTDGVLNYICSIVPFFSSYAANYQLVEGESIFSIGSLLQTFIYCFYLYNRKKIIKGKDEFTVSVIDKSMLAQIIFHFLSFKLAHVARIGLYFNFYFYMGLAIFHKTGRKINFRELKLTYGESFLIAYGVYQFVIILISNRFTSLPYSFWL